MKATFNLRQQKMSGLLTDLDAFQDKESRSRSVPDLHSQTQFSESFLSQKKKKLNKYVGDQN